MGKVSILMEASVSRGTTASLPLTVSEDLIHRFCWYSYNEIQEGMNLNGVLYNLVAEFEPDERDQAYDFAHELAAQGSRVVITAAHSQQDQYCVWVDLRDWSCQLAS